MVLTGLYLLNLKETVSSLMETAASLPNFKQPATGPYPAPIKLIFYPQIPRLF
jgi:hypothetical protein